VHKLLRTFLIGLLIVPLVEAPMLAAPSPAMGVVVRAEGARLGSGKAIAGATVFSGDTLTTDAAGTLHVRVGAAQLCLLANSAAAVGQTSSGVSAVLGRGTVIFSSASAGAIEVHASEARIRPRTAQLTYAQVILVGAYEFLITSQRGSLEVIIGDELHAVPEASSYRVLIDPEPQGLRGAGSPSAAQDRCNTRLFLKDGTFLVVQSYELRGDRVRYSHIGDPSGWEEIPAERVDWEATRKAEKERNKKCGGPALAAARGHLIAIPILGGIAVGTGIGIWRALVSPDRP